MMTSRKIDKIMKNVMLMYQAEAVKEFASYPDTPVEFSPEFENNMRMLSEGSRRKIIRVNRRRRIAKVAIALTTAFTMLTAFVARDKIIDFFVRVFEDRTALSTQTDESDIINTIYVIKYIPKEYVLESKVESKKSYFAQWKSGDKLIKYFQMCSKSNDILVDDNNGDAYSCKEVNGITVYHLDRKDRQVVVWDYDGYNFQLNCPSDLDWETITQMITSLAPQE